MKTVSIAAVGVGLLALAGCEKAIEAPFDRGVCYAVERGDGSEAPRFNKVADEQPQIEFCAARLEEVRLRFSRLGATRQDIIGSYQGQFIFIDRGGVWIAQSLDGGRFNLMARTGDGRLAMPGAIRRAIDGTPVAVSANPEPDPTAPPSP
jgi:hypothetical protein